MDTITTYRNYRRFIVTNPGRGNWQFELDGHGNSAKTYREAMVKIDRWYEAYDKAVAYLANNAEPTVPADIAEYRDLRTKFMRAQENITSGGGYAPASLWSLRHEATLQDELAKTEAIIEYRKKAIAEVEILMGEIKELGADIAEREQALSYSEYRYCEAQNATTTLRWLA